MESKSVSNNSAKAENRPPTEDDTNLTDPRNLFNNSLEVFALDSLSSESDHSVHSGLFISSLQISALDSLSSESDPSVHGGHASVSDLPVAAPISNYSLTEVEGTNLVIEGTVVDKERKWKIYIERILYLSIVITIVLILFSVLRDPKNDNPEVPSTLSPTLTSPTISSEYLEYLKPILMEVSGEDVLNDVNSMQHRMMLYISLDFQRLLDESILEFNDTEAIKQRYVILVVGISVGRLSLGNLNPTTDLRIFPHECDVPFFTCNEDRQLTGLLLENEWMSRRGGGFIASEIAALPELKMLLVTRSGVQSTIPTELGLLSNLEVLDLRDNFISGIIPSEFGRLQNLQYLTINGNEFRGQIPAEIGNITNMFYLDISNNEFTGTIPSEFMNLHNLKGLGLRNNSITGDANFLCKKNFTFESGMETFIYVEQRPFTRPIHLGLSVDCTKVDLKVRCDCCEC